MTLFGGLKRPSNFGGSSVLTASATRMKKHVLKIEFKRFRFRVGWLKSELLLEKNITLDKKSRAILLKSLYMG